MALGVATVRRFLDRAVFHTHPRVWSYLVDVESLDVAFAVGQGSPVWDVADCEDAVEFDERSAGGSSSGGMVRGCVEAGAILAGTRAHIPRARREDGDAQIKKNDNKRTGKKKTTLR